MLRPPLKLIYVEAIIREAHIIDSKPYFVNSVEFISGPWKTHLESKSVRLNTYYATQEPGNTLAQATPYVDSYHVEALEVLPWLL